MNQPSSNSEQPESSQQRIDQQSSGNSLGGQQAVNGNNNNQFQDNSTHYHNHNYSGELRDEDLEPLTLKGKILSYFGIFIILVSTLIFWFFFGLFIDFPFPFGQAIELIESWLKGKVRSKVNNLQKQLQLKYIDFPVIDKLNEIDFQVIKELNEIDFQARLYLRILECLGRDKVKNHESLAKTLEALRQKRIVLQDKIKPYQSKEYQTVSKAQDFFESFIVGQTEEDIVQIETILFEVTSFIRNGYPSETIVQDALDKLSREVTRKAGKISPNRLGILYRIEALLREVSAKEMSNLEDSELQSINRKVIGMINTLNSDLVKAKEGLRGLQGQKTSLNEEITQLRQTLQQKQVNIDQLTSQVNQYSQIRMLEGDYIGNLSNPKSKYHFNRKCDAWKMLVGEYVLNLGSSRKIVSSKTSDFFVGKLDECQDCAKNK